MAEPSTATEMVRVPILGENGRISDDYVPEAIPQAVTAVKQAAEAAASSANDALQQAAAAEKAASSATSSVEQAKTYASNASTYMTTAESHADSAAADATAASQSASDAAASAEAAAQSASSIGTAAKDAQAAATAAKESASQAATSASEASASAIAADDASQDAETSASNAKASETAANSSATKAAASASQASSSATAAAGSATNAAGSATAAEKSKNDAQAILNEANAKFIESATATTLDPGQPATAEVVDNVLNLGIPQGAKGEKGDTGTGVPDGGTPGQLLSKTDSGTAWVDPPSGNVLKGTATGYVAHAEDAYAQKPIEVRVKGKTWVNRWPKINMRSNGISVSTDETGLVTVAGQLEVTTQGAYLFATLTNLVAGKSISVLSSRGLPDGVYLYVSFMDEAGGLLNPELQLGFNSTSETQKTATVPNGTVSARAGVAVKRGTTLEGSLTFRVMLVEGSEAPDCFTLPASITSVQTGNLVTAGKNLLPPVSEWSAGGGWMRYIENRLPIGTQLVGRYGGNPNGLSGNVRMEFREDYASDVYSSEITPWSSTSAAGSAVTVTARDRYICIATAEEAAAYFDQMQVQLELGSTATAYEPPNVTQTPLPEVELRSLPDGTCDELVIKSDGTCRVERRTQLAGGEVTALPEPTTEPQSPVSLPQLPAPTFNQYHDSPVPSDTSTEYARDINLVLANLEAVQTALLGGE